MPDLAIAIWKVKPDVNWDLETRLKKLRVAVDAAVQAVPMIDLGGNDDFMPSEKPYDGIVFVAPEYYLGKTDLDGKFLDERHRVWAEERLKQIASKYSHLLLIAGSMVWTKTRYRTGLNEGSEEKRNALFKDVRTRYKSLHDSLQDDGEYGTLRAEREKATIRRWQLKSINDKGQVRLIKNTALIAKAGFNQIMDREPDVVISRYDKVFDFYDQGTIWMEPQMHKPSFTMEVPYKFGDEVDGEKVAPIFVTGRKSPQLDWLGLKVGVEICMDHEVGALRVRGLTGLDLQVILSSTTALKLENTTVKFNGLIVHCDTDEEVGAWRRTFGGKTALTKHQVWGEGLTLWTTS